MVRDCVWTGAFLAGIQGVSTAFDTIQNPAFCPGLSPPAGTNSDPSRDWDQHGRVPLFHANPQRHCQPTDICEQCPWYDYSLY